MNETTAEAPVTEAHSTAPADESVAASLGLDPQMFFTQFINFAVIGIIVWFLILRPLSKKMAERAQLINESLDKAEAIDAQFHLAEQKAREVVDEAKMKANQIVSTAHDEARAVGEKMKIDAREEIDMLVVQAKKHIQDEREVARAELQREVAQLVVAATEKIVAVKLDAKTDEELITSTLKDLSDTQKTS